MNYTMTTPCDACPFTMTERQFSRAQLEAHASGPFACHKTCNIDEDGTYQPNKTSVHCAGALIYLEKRGRPNQMMRIARRLKMYNHTQLDMNADVR